MEPNYFSYRFPCIRYPTSDWRCRTRLQSFRCRTRTSGSLRRKCAGANHKTTSGKEGRWWRQKKAEGKTILPAPETNTTGNTSRIMAGRGAGGRWRNQRAFMQIKLQKLLGTRELAGKVSPPRLSGEVGRFCGKLRSGWSISYFR